MRISPSARRYGIADEDMLHVARQVLAGDRVEDGLLLLLGADWSGRMLEVLISGADGDDPAIIHAMPLRAKFRPLLPRR